MTMVSFEIVVLNLSREIDWMPHHRMYMLLAFCLR